MTATRRRSKETVTTRAVRIEIAGVDFREESGEALKRRAFGDERTQKLPTPNRLSRVTAREPTELGVFSLEVKAERELNLTRGAEAYRTANGARQTSERTRGSIREGLSRLNAVRLGQSRCRKSVRQRSNRIGEV